MMSQKARYALRALMALARLPAQQTVMISEIAAGERIPHKFLEQILLDLKHQGLVYSRRGRGGGYGLLKRPEEITFGQVVRGIDGPMAPLPCLSRTAYRRCSDCPDEARCGMRRVFAKAHAATTAVLDSTTLATLLDNPARDQEAPTSLAVPAASQGGHPA
ncbi:RrF2 family transcriptional regulator [Aquibaculum arenosum]|uniref:Rrf2 family transcriptional regulator n=1 Tax=Aquibaculum arenosum TaxID=3032591 RepID=A0ABT5YIM4_9PROT|nr:Rrf2 family transcriptional regulator [Fodinicurvata sp. CAU 1616]MDF2094676.1 Rrf2 family transcriptional regulator [Fodinicurvata sp. CAU 1616]